jgi:hypothetical protein
MISPLPESVFVLSLLLGPNAAYDCAVVGKKVIQWHYQYTTGQTREAFKYPRTAKACLEAGYYDD